MGYCCPKSITTYRPTGNLEGSRRQTGQSKVFVGVVFVLIFAPHENLHICVAVIK